MQHSCVPNVINKFASDFDAEVTALRNIEAGEELVHSYVDVSHSFKKRVRILQLWGFAKGCECSACVNKLDLSDRESDHDEDEDDDEDDDDDEEDEEQKSE
jgi:hypothetical protein